MKLDYLLLGKWLKFFDELAAIHNLTFRRSLTPDDYIRSILPILIILSDGSINAYGAVAYIRWETYSGFDVRIVMAKTRIAPLKIVDIVRLELSGAVLSKRVRTYIQKHLDFNFQRIYHIVDSEIVKAMISKDSYGFNTFAANRVGEIQQSTRSGDWYWISGKDNVADCLTRGLSPKDLDIDSVWQSGPAFLKLLEDEWPLS